MNGARSTWTFATSSAWDEMNSNDIVIHARDLRKVYRLYAGPGYRFLDMFGMLGNRPGAYTEHAALDGVSLDIRRGEKVAFIGRNGAGKSTLLKLFTKVIEPTSGTLEVKGKAHALLQIGSGFHPDFTGRENVYAYLAQLGVAGREADRKYAEIVEFAELEEYIGQPVKTYSSGMAVRLMFSTSTAITPDLLVLDEVLGVGDAYFAHKSYERIRSLCEHDGSTLLLVSHDIYTAAKICTRMIWIDQGRVMVDLEPAEALKIYENSIRIQEEQRLRKKAALALQPAGAPLRSGTADILIVEFATSRPPAAGPTHFSQVALYRNGTIVAAAPLAANSSSPVAALVTEGTIWSGPIEWQGRGARSMLHFGSPFHKVAVLFRAEGLEASAASGELTLEVDYGSTVPVKLDMRAFLNGRGVSLGPLPPAAGGWMSHRTSIPAAGAGSLDLAPTPDRVGTGAIAIRGARLIDEHGQESLILQHGRPLRFEFDFEVADPDLVGPVGVGIAILRGGVETACRLFVPDLYFDGRNAPRGTIEMSVGENWLGTGAYSLTVMLTRAGYADQPAHLFFSISPDVYACVRDLIEFEVRGGGLFATGTPILARGAWAIKAESGAGSAI
jgi:ABC-type polysaccharide/polyol phosphate transport system ATPase subunit